MTRRAITLIETAATTTAVAALLCLLVPTLAGIRSDGRNKKCLSNLAQIATASAAFAATSDFLTPTHRLMGRIDGALGEVEWGGRSGRGDILSGQASDVTNSLWGTRFGRGPESRKLNDIIYGRTLPNFQVTPGADDRNWINDTNLNLDIFKCPADTGYTGLHYNSFKQSRLSSYDHYGNSYTTATNWVMRVPNPPDCRIRSASAFLHRTSEIPNPANTLVFMENAGKFAWRVNLGANGSCGGGGQPTGDPIVTGWHNRPWLFNAAFADGHVTTIEMNGHQQPQPQIGIYPNCDNDPDLCYLKFRCSTIRGPGWQLDTFPAPPLRSVIECGNPRGAIFTNFEG